jgi:hypothetical protein
MSQKAFPWVLCFMIPRSSSRLITGLLISEFSKGQNSV